MYTTEQLIDEIKQNTATAFSQNRLSASTVINLVDQETKKRIRPIVADLQKEFFVVTISKTVEEGTQHVRLPKRCAARGLRDIYYEINNDRYYLSQLTREQAIDYGPRDTGTPDAFYFEADSINFLAPLNQQIDLKLVIEVEPGKLVEVSNYTTITSVDFDTGVVSFSGTPTGFGSVTEYDFVQQNGYGNAAIGIGLVPTSVSGTTYTFKSSELPKTLEVGDYAALGGNTPVPNMPDEAIVCLIHAVSARIFRTQADWDAMKAEERELKNAIIYLERALTNRVEGQRPVVINAQRMLRNTLNRRRRYN